MSVDQFLLSADTTDLNYPEIRPTLDLNFARTKTLDPRITFTRSSGGSYVGADGLIKFAGVNEARFDHDPVTGESLGLLIEEARVNRTTSSDYSTVTLSNVSRSTTVSTTAPDGSTVFSFDANDNTSVVHRINLTNGSTGDATVPHTASFFIKIPPIGSSDQISNNDRLRFVVRWRSSSESGTGSTFDYFHSTQTFRFTSGINAFGSNQPATYNITTNNPYFEKFPNGWYRLVFPGAVASNTSADSFVLYDWNISETNVEQGGNCSVFLWGAQFEQGAFPTSYIPTQGSTRTRASDNASITGKNFSEWYRQDEGTVFLGGMKHNTTLESFRMPYDLSDGSANNEIHLALNLGNHRVYSAIITNGVVRITNVGGNLLQPFLSGDPKSSGATSWDNGKIVSAFRGEVRERRLDISLPYILRLDIGKRVNNTIRYTGTISRLTYFPKRLPNAQLQALTR